MSGPLIDYSLSNYPSIENALTALPLADVLSQIIAINSRVLLLLCACLFLLKVSRGSAANRHLFLFLSLCATLCLPIAPALIPPIEFEVESTVAWLPSIASAVNQDFIGASFSAWSTTDILMLLFLAVYAGGAAWLLSKIAWENALVWLVIRLSKPVEESSWILALRQQSDKLSIGAGVSLRYSSAVVSPLTWGIFRPVILLPAEATQWPVNLINSTLLHELAHIRRHDWFLQQVARCICACYWPNPLCWLAFKKLCGDAETACDDTVLNTGVRQSYYAGDLLHVAKQVHRQNYRLATIGMAEPRGTTELRRRVQAILNPDRLRNPNSLLQVAVTFVVVSGLLLPLSSLRATYVQVTTILTPVSPAAVEDAAPGYQVAFEPFDKSMLTIKRPQLQRVSMPIDMSNIKMIAEREIRKTFAFIDKNALGPLAAAPLNTPTTRPIASTQSSAMNEQTGDATAKEVLAKASTDDLLDEIKEASSSFPTVIPELVPIEYSRTAIIDIAAREDRIETYSREKIVKPSYPRRARERGIEGEVIVEFDIDRRGKVVNPQVIQATPSGIFDSAVLKAIKQFSFNPHKINGEAVSIEGVRETFVFVIET